MKATVIFDTCREGSLNMALDSLLLQQLREEEQVFLRFYTWCPATVSIGLFQKWQQRQKSRKGDRSLSLVLLKGVSKSFGDQRVLENVSLNISEGEFTVLVGPNGAGKSTLLRIMVGLLLPDEGEVNILGFDVKKHWKKLARYIGVVLANERSLYWKLTAWENLDIFGGIYNVPKKKRIERAEELLNFFGLYDDKDKLVEDYSTGMRKKLLLCKALIHQPKILFIDEILNGLDVNAVIQVNSFLEKSSKDGVTVVMVSHILHNLSEDAKIVLLKNGKIELISRYGDIFASKDVYNQLSELFLQSSEYAENE